MRLERVSSSTSEPSQNVRYRVHLEDGAVVEAVRYHADTLCLSTQVGCAVACPFCASGAHGLQRPLSEHELRFQVEAAAEEAPLARLTLSGVGEPLHAHGATYPFLEWARSRGLPTSVTTSGGPLSRLRQWLHAPHNGLTISCHAGTEATRARMVPKGPGLGNLFAALREEQSQMTRKRQKKTALAYLLLEGANDDADELDAFAARALPLGYRVHLYEHNAVATSDARSPSADRFERVAKRWESQGLRVVRASKARRRANGGCGTLVALRTR